MREFINSMNNITSMESGALLGWAALGTLVAVLAGLLLIGISRLLGMAVDACGNWEDK